MDHLINFMNNNHSFSLPLFHFLLITNPIAFPYSFFTPCSEIDYSQENFGIKAVESGSVLFGLQWCFIGFLHSWLLLSLSSNHVLFPLIMSCLSQYKPLTYPREPFFTPYSLINNKTICMDWIAWVWCIVEPILFHIFKELSFMVI